MTCSKLLHHSCCLGGVLALSSDRGSEPVEPKWQRRTCECQERRHARSPVDAQVLEHISREQRERGAEERTKHGIRCEYRGRVDGVGVDKVIRNTEEEHHVAESEGPGKYQGDDPMDSWIVRPSEDE